MTEISLAKTIGMLPITGAAYKRSRRLLVLPFMFRSASLYSYNQSGK